MQVPVADEEDRDIGDSDSVHSVTLISRFFLDSNIHLFTAESFFFFFFFFLFLFLLFVSWLAFCKWVLRFC